MHMQLYLLKKNIVTTKKDTGCLNTPIKPIGSFYKLASSIRALLFDFKRYVCYRYLHFFRLATLRKLVL